MGKSSFQLTQFQLKIIAVICMLIDHLGYAYYQMLSDSAYLTLRCIGRLAFPLFAFFLAEGFLHTKNISRHLMLLGIFALVSEIPYDLFRFSKLSDFRSQNVLVTFFLAFTGLIMFNRLRGEARSLAFLMPVLAELIHSDYGAVGVFTVYLFYYAAVQRPEGRKGISFPEALFALFPLIIYALFVYQKEYACLFTLPFLMLYKGERGRRVKYFFYVFYPAHMLFIAYIAGSIPF